MADPGSAAELVAASTKGDNPSGLGLVKAWVHHALTANLGFKAVAFLLAVALFVLVHSDQDRVIPVTVKLSYKSPRPGLTLVEEPPPTARVGIKGSRRRLNRLVESDLDPIAVTLTDTGEFRLLPEMVKPLPQGLSVASISPTSVSMIYESTEDKSVTIRPRLVGEPAPGYRIESIVSTPSTVQIRGAESAVARLDELTTATLSVDGLALTKTFEATLETPAFPAQVVQGESLVAPSEVAVSIRVTMSRAAAELTVAKVPVVIDGGNAESWMTDPSEVRVSLRGYQNELDGLDAKAVRAKVTLYPGDQSVRATRLAVVEVTGVPEGIAVSVVPASVKISPR